MDSRTYLWVGYTVIAIVVFLTLFSTISRKSDIDATEDLISINLVWLQQVLYASNDNIELSYVIGENYSALFELPCIVSVGKAGTPIFAGAKSFCVLNKYDELIYPSTVISSGTVDFLKTEDMLEVRAGE